METSMRRRKIGCRRDDRCDSVRVSGNDSKKNRIGAFPDDQGGIPRGVTEERGVIEVAFHERIEKLILILTFGINDPMAKKLVFKKNFFYAIKKTKKWRPGNEPGTIL